MEQWCVRSSENMENYSISMENEIQSSWIPGTPMNPIPRVPSQIYSGKPPKEMNLPYMSYTPQVIRQKFDELVESNSFVHDFSLAGSSGLSCNDIALMGSWDSNNTAIAAAGVGSISFTDQLALADANASSSSISNFGLDSSSSLLLENPDLEFHSRQETKSSIRKSTEVPSMHDLCLTGETVLVVDNDEVANVSMELDKGSTIDLNQTPQQQKPRRKKHRPRVVKEGALKKTPRFPNPVVVKETAPTGKRKYVRRNTQNNNSCTTTPPQTEKRKGIAEMKSVKPRDSCRRALNFDLDEQPLISPSPTPRILNDYKCSTNTCVIEEVMVRGSKRQHSQTFGQEQSITSSNLKGSDHDTLKHFLFNIHAFVKKKRTDKVTLSPLSPVTRDQMAPPRNNRNSSSISDMCSTNRVSPMTLQVLSIPSLPEKLTKKKRTKVKTRARASLPIREPKITLQSLLEKTQGILKKKKRTRKEKPVANPLVSGASQKGKLSIDMLGHELSRLHISNENPDIGKLDIVPHKIDNHQGENAIVLYRRDGTIVPLEGSERKRRPRPKVDLDEETTRVWKLLLENINNDGIDGSDVEKARWWEGERSVFIGRANSFIARMHLIQGDRRFSQWKGSVLDSVIGVFLTQNVSDHLSSSAFMSLGARFPLKSEGSHDETSVLVKEKDSCIVNLMETIEWNGNIPNLPACNLYQEVVNNGEFSGGRNSRNRALDFFESAILANSGSIEDDILSRNSIDSSQNSTDLSINLTGEKIGSCSGSNSEAEELTMVSKFGDVERPYSFTEHLQIAGTTYLSEFHIEKNNDLLVVVENLENVENFQNKEIVAETLSSKLLVKDQSSHELKYPSTEIVDGTAMLDHPKNIENLSVESNLNAGIRTAGKRGPKNKEPQEKPDWSKLKREAEVYGKKREKSANTMDSLDWEAVRLAHVDEIADAIKERGMNNMLAERIKAFLNRLVEEHGSTDLEWLRDIPPDKAKEYLLSVRGLGLKSVECVRLLTLHHLAFPVDTNVGRIAVRLGWVPLQPLPESLQLHLLELYPVLESIQKYLWPRLCKLDQRTLYELHYQMITFGKVFCTKSKPNCNACPMRAECRHFASAYASARLALPGPEEKNLLTTQSFPKDPGSVGIVNPYLLLPPPPNQQIIFKPKSTICKPIIEEPASPEPEKTLESVCDIEDTICCVEDPYEIPTIKLNIEEFIENLQNHIQMNMECHAGEMSKALVALTPEAASIPMPKLKNVNRLRTEHQVYELPDSHPLLNGFDKREADDPSSYLLAIWTPGETATSFEKPESMCDSQENGKLCEQESCLSCNSFREANSQTVRGTILIPCRTANRGSFPLNGTYFQVNEVFADHDSSLNPIDVPRCYLWNLSRRTVYFGTSIPTIFKGLSTEGIQHCFWRGFVCVRGFDRKFRAPKPLMARLHFPVSKWKRAEKL